MVTEFGEEQVVSLTERKLQELSDGGAGVKLLDDDVGRRYFLPAAVQGVLETLTQREKRVIELRFGIGDGQGRSMVLEEVGQELCVTSERIRQIERKALRKLRHPTRSRKLKEYLE